MDREKARLEHDRLAGSGRPRGRPFVASVLVSGLYRLPGGPGGATLLGCGLCGQGLSGVGGPTRESVVCQMCATALRDARHPLGALLRESWRDAIRGLYEA